MTLHLNRRYDFAVIRQRLAARGLASEIACNGGPVLIMAGQRWVVERTTAWTDAHKKRVWCTERLAVGSPYGSRCGQ